MVESSLRLKTLESLNESHKVWLFRYTLHRPNRIHWKRSLIRALKREKVVCRTGLLRLVSRLRSSRAFASPNEFHKVIRYLWTIARLKTSRACLFSGHARYFPNPTRISAFDTRIVCCDAGLEPDEASRRSRRRMEVVLHAVEPLQANAFSGVSRQYGVLAFA